MIIFIKVWVGLGSGLPNYFYVLLTLNEWKMIIFIKITQFFYFLKKIVEHIFSIFSRKKIINDKYEVVNFIATN